MEPAYLIGWSYPRPQRKNLHGSCYLFGRITEVKLNQGRHAKNAEQPEIPSRAERGERRKDRARNFGIVGIDDLIGYRANGFTLGLPRFRDIMTSDLDH